MQSEAIPVVARCESEEAMSTDDIYLVNYRHSKCEPLKSITQLPKNEAFALAQKIYEDSHCRAHRRFGPDFVWYYPHRLKTEKWLYDRFIEIGGKPQTEHPFYFALDHCENYYVNFDNGLITKINLNDIDKNDVSFTFGDSVAQMESPNKPEPFLKDKLFEYISAFDNNVIDFLESIKSQYVCIEAQLWTDKYFEAEANI